jgi:hypothetical protein
MGMGIDLDTAEVVNRRDCAEEAMFDGQVVKFKPLGSVTLPRTVAYCIVNQAAMQIDMATGLKSQYKFGIRGDDQWPCNPLDGKYAYSQPLEALDRSGIEESSVSETVVLEGSKDKEVIKKKKDPGRYEAKITGIEEPKGSQARSDFENLKF